MFGGCVVLFLWFRNFCQGVCGWTTKVVSPGKVGVWSEKNGRMLLPRVTPKPNYNCLCPTCLAGCLGNRVQGREAASNPGAPGAEPSWCGLQDWGAVQGWLFFIPGNPAAVRLNALGCWGVVLVCGAGHLLLKASSPVGVWLYHHYFLQKSSGHVNESRELVGAFLAPYFSAVTSLFANKINLLVVSYGHFFYF